MPEIWIIFALIAALAQAINPLINEYFKVSSIYLLFWVRVIVALMLAPVALSLPAPDDLVFYLSVLGAVSCFSYFDLVYFGQAAKKGAGMVTRFEGLVVGITFLLWLAVDPVLVVKYMEEPLRAGGIVLSLTGGVYFALKMRRCEITLETLREMLPAIILAGLGIVFGKIAMVHSGHHSGVWYYTFLQSFWMIFVYGTVLFIPRFSARFKAGGGTRLFDLQVFRAAAVLSLGWLAHTVSKYYAITDVENPAYVTIIGLTAPFMVVLIYMALGRQEEADVKSGLALVLCAISLVCFAQL